MMFNRFWAKTLVGSIVMFLSGSAFSARAPFQDERECYESLRGYAVSLNLHLRKPGWIFLPDRKGGRLGFTVVTARKSFFVKFPYRPHAIGATDYRLSLRLPGEKVIKMMYHHEANWTSPGASVTRAERYPLTQEFAEAKGAALSASDARRTLQSRLLHYVRTVEDAYRMSSKHFSKYMPTPTWDEFSAHLDACKSVKSKSFQAMLSLERGLLDRSKPAPALAEGEESRGLASEEEPSSK